MISSWDEWFPFCASHSDSVKKFFKEIEICDPSFPDLIKFSYLIKNYHLEGPKALFVFEQLQQEKSWRFNCRGDIYKSLSLINLLEKTDLARFEQHFKTKHKYEFDYFKSAVDSRPINGDLLSELLNFEIQIDDPMAALYAEGVKLFLLLSVNRKIPGILILKDSSNQWVRLESGLLWSLPVLASSKFDFPFYSSNGQTPQGFFAINGVMPEANRSELFGRNRRLIIDFFPKLDPLMLESPFIPYGHKDLSWWKQAEIAREIGRRFLRIHGTGLVCKESNSTYAPFVRTSGCLATREVPGQFDDQRILLDQLMRSMDLDVSFENESKINGLLTIVEISATNSLPTIEQLSDMTDL